MIRIISMNASVLILHSQQTSALLSLKMNGNSWIHMLFLKASLSMGFSCSRCISWCRLKSAQFVFSFNQPQNGPGAVLRTNSKRTQSQESSSDRRNDYPSQVACRVEPAEAKHSTYPPSVICAPFVPQLLIRCSLILWSSVGGQITNDWTK